MQQFFVNQSGRYVGSYLGPQEDIPPIFSDTVEVSAPPEDNRQLYNFETGTYNPPPVEFLPIEPTTFWLAAWDLLQLKKSDVVNSITDPDERYEAELQIEGRKTYLRNDPMVVQLATLLGYPAEQMDDLWLFVQANYA